ncbi:MAG TPA: phosphatase domain-containing protein [Amnibacterium sp.]|nr:phosphatase domain-containing protein [Amnibacterium sp.]
MAAPGRPRFRRRTPPPAVEQAVGRAMRIDDAIRRFREQRARRRGLVPTVIPYTGYGAPGWVRVLGRVLLVGTPGGAAKAESVRGWRSFTSVAVDRQRVKVTIGDVVHHVLADRGGVIDVRLEARLEPGWHRIRVETEGEAENALPVEAPVFVVDPAAPFGIISDIDDTVMVTALPRPLLAAWNTFVLDEHARAATPGMAVLYDRLHRAHPEAPVIYLSTGAWNVAPTLTRFLSRNLYPPGPLLLTDWGPTPDRIFRSGRQHKIDQLERMAEEFPEMRWLLIGDDGQHDEETYGGFAEDHPENVAAVCIRRLSPGEAVLAGGRSREGGSRTPPGVHWISSPDGKGLADELANAGFL